MSSRPPQLICRPTSNPADLIAALSDPMSGHPRKSMPDRLLISSRRSSLGHGGDRSIVSPSKSMVVVPSTSDARPDTISSTICITSL